MDAYEHATRIVDIGSALQYNLSGGTTSMALHNVASIHEHMQELAILLCQQAYNDGMSKKDICAIFGFPASTLRGMQKTTINVPTRR